MGLGKIGKKVGGIAKKGLKKLSPKKLLDKAMSKLGPLKDMLQGGPLKGLLEGGPMSLLKGLDPTGGMLGSALGGAAQQRGL